jgi:hypothetical protein
VNDCAAPRHDEPEPAVPGAWLCHGCTRGLRRDLRDLPGLYARLGEFVVPLNCADPGAGNGSSGGLPFNDPVSECRSQIRKDLRFWANWIIEVRLPSAWPVLTVDAMAAWLTGYASWASCWEHGVEMAGAFAADRGWAVALLNPRPVENFPLPPGCGYCPSCGADSTLRAIIHQDPGDPRPSTINCGCGHEWDASPWLRRLYAALDRKAAA